MAAGFLKIPRELRDQVYAECLLVRGIIPLSNLRTDASLRPLHQELGLNPSILRICRQVHKEGTLVLYSENFFYADLIAPWAYIRPLRWRQCFQLNPSDLVLCLKCQTQSGAVCPSTNQDMFSWIASIQLVRRLQLSIRPYSFLQWQFKQRSAFPDRYTSCTHTLPAAIPMDVSLDLLIVRMSKRSLMFLDECQSRDSWTLLALRYSTGDSVAWRKQAKRDVAREARALFALGGRIARTTLFAGPGFVPYLSSPLVDPLPRWLIRILHSGKVLEQDEEGAIDISHVGFVLGEWFRRVSTANDDRLVDIDGPGLARKSFKDI